ncbi:MAG TPA: FAD-binding oxidoreductase [Vicinamibacterales bacterium]|jgi:ferredoxin--NADP+ reductase
MPRDLATIVRRQDFTADLFALWLRPQRPLSFTAGQYLTIGVNSIERPYSIVSAPYERLIELFIERVPPDKGGTLTPLLHRLRAGDSVTMRSTAKGRFTISPAAHHHVMVATVTGIAPYVSMIRQAARERAQATATGDIHFYVLHGASFADELVYDRELQRLSDEDPLFIQYVASVSRPSAERNARWRGAVGRVNEILERQLARWSPPKDDTVIYLCGHPGMIADAEGRLVPQGWSVAQEQYWVARAHLPAFAGA